jgi:hypothetical protein
LRLAQTRASPFSGEGEALCEAEDPCIICHESLRDGSSPVAVHEACRREFHQKCIDDWEKRSPRCPNCQAPMRWVYPYERGRNLAIIAQFISWFAFALFM